MPQPAFPCEAHRLVAWRLSEVLILAPSAFAQTDVPSHWPPKPAGLVAGGEFRLLLMDQDGLKATSAVIAGHVAFGQGGVLPTARPDIQPQSYRSLDQSG